MDFKGRLASPESSRQSPEILSTTILQGGVRVDSDLTNIAVVMIIESMERTIDRLRPSPISQDGHFRPSAPSLFRSNTMKYLFLRNHVFQPGILFAIIVTIFASPITCGTRAFASIFPKEPTRTTRSLKKRLSSFVKTRTDHFSVTRPGRHRTVNIRFRPTIRPSRFTPTEIGRPAHALRQRCNR